MTTYDTEPGPVHPTNNTSHDKIDNGVRFSADECSRFSRL